METMRFKINPVKEHAGFQIYRAFTLNQLFELGNRYISIWHSSIEEVFKIPTEQYAPLDGVIEPFIITHLGEYIFLTVRYDDDCLRVFISPKCKLAKMRELADLYAKHKDLINIVDAISIID